MIDRKTDPLDRRFPGKNLVSVGKQGVAAGKQPLEPVGREDHGFPDPRIDRSHLEKPGCFRRRGLLKTEIVSTENKTGEWFADDAHPEFRGNQRKNPDRISRNAPRSGRLA